MDYYKLAQNYRQNIIDETCDLMRIPSVKGAAVDDAPYGIPLKTALEHMLALGRKHGFRVANYDNYAGEIIYGTGEETVGVLCHLDVVPPQAEGWSHPPFEPWINDGIIFGRGSNDNKGPTMAAFFALVALKEIGFQPKRQIKLILGCDEEGNMTCMDHYKKQASRIPNFGFVPDATFPVNYGEHGLYSILASSDLPDYIVSLEAGEHNHILAERCTAVIKETPKDIERLFQEFLKDNNYQGDITFQIDSVKLELIGKAAHGSRPYQGLGAGSGMLRFLGEIYQDDKLSTLGRYFDDWKGKELAIDYSSEKNGELSCCLARITSRERVFECYMDIRYPFDHDKITIFKQFEQILVENSLANKIKILEDREGCYNDPNGWLVKTLETIYRNQTKDNISKIKISAGDTYARKFKDFVAFGPTTKEHLVDKRIGQAHQVGEGMDIETLIRGCAIYIETIRQLSE